MRRIPTNLYVLSFLCFCLFVCLPPDALLHAANGHKGSKIGLSTAPPQNNNVLIADLAEQIEATDVFKEMQVKVKQVSKGKSELMVLLYATPSEDYDYYYFKAGERTGNGFVIHLNFRIYPGDLAIHMYDPTTDKEYTIEEFAQLER